TCLARKRREALASRPRPVPGLKPGSTALKCKRGVSCANSRAVARAHCFDVAYASYPGFLDPPGFHAPRALASAEMYRPSRNPATLGGLRSGSSTPEALKTIFAPSARYGMRASVSTKGPR